MSATLGYLLKKFPRLSETFVLNEILGQESLGRRIHIFSRRPPDDEPRHVQMGRLRATVEELPPATELEPWGLLFGSPIAKRLEVDRLRALVEEVLAFDHPRMPRLLSEAVHLLGRTEELSIGHVHVHFATDSAVTAMLLADLGGPSYSVTAHAKDIYRSTVDPRLLSRIVEHSAFTVTVCDANVEYLQGLLTPEASGRVRRLYNGIDLEVFGGASEPRPSHILSVGRLVPKKGLDILLRALADLRRAGRDVEATIVGEGEDREALGLLARELNLDGSVTFSGPLPQHEVREMLGRAAVFCLPCRIDADGNRDALPTVLLEALALGVPIVSTSVTGIPEILDGGRVGELLAPDDPQAVAASLERLLSDQDLRQTYAERGRQWARQRFDSRAASATLSRWFDEALQEVVYR